MHRILLPTALAAVAAAQPALAQSPSAFNPAISLTLMGVYAGYDGAALAPLPGVQLGGEPGLPEEGLGLGHSELTLSSNIDPQFFGQLTAAFATHESETELELEEAFVETTALPYGLGLTFGRFFSEIGYSNGRHRHAWDFVDAPLPVQALLGGGYYDDGVRLRWVAPTATFLELGAEAFRGGRFPAAAADGEEVGAYTAFVHLGGDVGASHSWQLGASWLWADAAARVGGHAHGHDHADAAPAFSGDSVLTVVDAVWKWAPGGNMRARNLVLQAEYFHRREDGVLAHNHDGEPATGRYDGSQQGLYAQAVLQFRPRWRTGLRYDRLWTDNGGDADLLAEAGFADANDPAQRASVMLEFATSEFARLRLQYTRSEIAGEPGNAWFLQYVMSLGAHGAHRF